MDAVQIKELIESQMKGAEAIVKADGNSVQLTVVSSEFEGLRTLKKQQMVYACLTEQIADGTIHAVTMQTHTPEEWEKAKLFQM